MIPNYTSVAQLVEQEIPNLKVESSRLSRCPTWSGDEMVNIGRLKRPDHKKILRVRVSPRLPIFKK